MATESKPAAKPAAPTTIKVRITDGGFKRGHNYVKPGTVIDATPGEAHSIVVNKQGELVK